MWMYRNFRSRCFRIVVILKLSFLHVHWLKMVYEDRKSGYIYAFQKFIGVFPFFMYMSVGIPYRYI